MFLMTSSLSFATQLPPVVSPFRLIFSTPYTREQRTRAVNSPCTQWQSGCRASRPFPKGPAKRCSTRSTRPWTNALVDFLMIVDASVVIDAVADSGSRGVAARAALADIPPDEALVAPGHLAVEVLSGLWAAARRPDHPLTEAEIPSILVDAEHLGIDIQPTPWSDVARAWELSRTSLRYADAVYVAMAEREQSSFLTADGRIERSGALFNCEVVTIRPST
jgi:predicted nucleic acid-binding protein